MNPELIIIRGLPGSGKSTLAKKFKNYIHVEADDYFMRDGEYKYIASLIKEAHLWCQEAVRTQLKGGHSVVVSNTFSRIWEMQPYLDMCKELGIRYTIITVRGEYGSVHNVPQTVIQKMKERWET